MLNNLMRGKPMGMALPAFLLYGLIRALWCGLRRITGLRR